MKKITRTQAEKLMHKSKVVETNVKKYNKGLCVFFTLSNGKSCLVKYDGKKHSKSYFLG